MTQIPVDREAILRTVRQWPLADQIALVQDVLDQLRRSVATVVATNGSQPGREEPSVESPQVASGSLRNLRGTTRHRPAAPD